MKLLFVFFLIFAVVEGSNFKKSTQTFFGTSNNWVKEKSAPQSFYITVDMSELNLKHKPFVSTYLECLSFCSFVEGTTSIYNITHERFTVVINYTYEKYEWSVENAVKFGWTLNYRIESLDP